MANPHRKSTPVSTVSKRVKQASSKPTPERLGAEDWILAAQEELITHGVLGVKVDRLARRLRVTRGGFYWHFRSHSHLLEVLLKRWVVTNTTPFIRVLELEGGAQKKFQAVVNLWVSETEYNPRLDSAVREWARVSPRVSRLMQREDDARVAVLQTIFRELGYEATDALVRARIAYFHQVGYYAMGIIEPIAKRRRLMPHYTRALLGEGLRATNELRGFATPQKAANEAIRVQAAQSAKFRS